MKKKFEYNVNSINHLWGDLYVLNLTEELRQKYDVLDEEGKDGFLRTVLRFGFQYFNKE